MTTAIGRYKKGKISLFSPDTGIETSKAEVTHVIVSALDASIHVLPTKLKKNEQIKSFITHYIKTIHPGPYENLLTDYVLEKREREKVIILIIIEKEIVTAYKTLGKPLTFFFQYGLKETFIYNHYDNMSETYAYPERVFSSVEIDQIQEVTHTEKKFEFKGLKNHNRKSWFDTKENKKETIWYLPTLFLLALFIPMTIFYTELSNNERSLNLSLTGKKMILEQKKTDSENVAASSAEEDLFASILQLQNDIPGDYYNILAVIAKITPNRISLKSFNVSDNNLTMSGSTRNTLELIEALNRTELFLEIKPSKIYPKENGNEDFSIQGVFK